MIFRLRDYVTYPRAIWREHAWLRAAESWPEARRRAWQQERLEELLAHAVRHVPWYRRTLGPFEARFPDMIHGLDLSELPVLTKQTVREHFAELQADDVAARRTSVVETSGSTGTPTRFVVDGTSNVHQFAAVWRMLNWTGYRFGQRYADMTGYLPRNDGLAAYDWRTNCLHLSSFNFKKEHMAEYVRRLERFRPALIKAYPSALHLFCQWLRELGLDDYRPRAALTCAESLLDHQRALIEDVLGCPVFDFYNQNERGALISTCASGTYHIHEEYALTELVRPAQDAAGAEPAQDAAGAEPAPPVNGAPLGGAGRADLAIVTTPFHNRAMPLIRYRTDDLASAGPPGPCACGRTYRAVGRIVGRVEDVVITADGRHVGRLDAAFKYSPGIRTSQVVQARVGELEVRYVPAATFASADLDRVEKELRARLGASIDIRYTAVDDIAPGPNGKVKFMVSTVGTPG